MSTVSFKIRARTMENIVLERMFHKQEVYRMLVSKVPEIEAVSEIYISDVFATGFVYKPISFDYVHIRSDEEYRVLKRIKSAKYIEKSLLDKVQNGEDLIRALMYGQAGISEEYICDSMEEKKTTFRRIVAPERTNPLVFRIPEGCIVDFYVSIPSEMEQVLNVSGQCHIEGYSIEIVDIEKVEAILQNGERFVLQSALEISETMSICPDSASLFRVGYNKRETCQYFKVGSVFETKDRVMPENRKVKPYFLFLEGEA